MALFPFFYHSNRRPMLCFVFCFSIIIICFCHLFPKTLQPNSTKLSDLCHDKICKKHTSYFLVLTSRPEIIKICVFLCLRFISESVNERGIIYSGMSATVPSAYPNVICHIRLSPEKILILFHFLFLIHFCHFSIETR